jgi:hypothetical protein
MLLALFSFSEMVKNLPHLKNVIPSDPHDFPLLFSCNSPTTPSVYPISFAQTFTLLPQIKYVMKNYRY